MTQTKRDTPLPPGCGLGVGGTTPPQKRICVQETLEIQWTGVVMGQVCGVLGFRLFPGYFVRVQPRPYAN